MATVAAGVGLVVLVAVGALVAGAADVDVVGFGLSLAAVDIVVLVVVVVVGATDWLATDTVEAEAAAGLVVLPADEDDGLLAIDGAAEVAVGAIEVVVLLLLFAVAVAVVVVVIVAFCAPLLAAAASRASRKALTSIWAAANCCSLAESLLSSARSFQLNKFEMNFGG